MPGRYFQLRDDMSIPTRWLLDDPWTSQGHEVDDPWQFADGCPVRVEERLRIPIYHPGSSLEFSHAGVGGAPVVHQRAATIFEKMAPDDVQLIPVDVDGQTEPYCLLVATRNIRCIDDQQTAEVKYWMPEDGQPEKVGEYRVVSGMRIDVAKVGNAKVFRPWGWTLALIVSEDIKDALERANVTGVRFEEVTGPSEVSPEEREHNRKLQALYERSTKPREAFWRTLGAMDDNFVIPIVVGGGWPARRQVWRVIHRPEGRALFVTDG
ncbi:imm11 family protein, partial [Corallococcus interemptor]|uniref:imm11 family protein n=1 Tax=Corallococcus interemptor TaxID=2316720 RepID=UPI003CFD0729